MTYKVNGIGRSNFLQSDKAAVLRNELEKMVKNPAYNTRVMSLLSDDASYFVEKHMKYMSDHLTMDHSQYIQNLKLMTKVRR